MSLKVIPGIETDHTAPDRRIEEQSNVQGNDTKPPVVVPNVPHALSPGENLK
jgi:hypothetical protein